jgi:MinD superfamily P-loop ATPase
VVEAIKGSDFCLLVTEPTPFGLNDLSLAVEVARMMGISSAVVINRAGIGNDEVEQYCQREGIPVLLTIPLDRSIALLYSKGTALVEDMPQWRQEFLGLFHNIKDLITAKGAA